MRVAGVAVSVPSRGRPTARLVVLDGSSGGVLESHDAFTSDDTDLATLLHDMAEAVRSRLEGVRVERVVVRRADRPPRASNHEGPRLRLLTEGAVVSAARSVVIDTRVGTGKDTGAWHGTDKATLDGLAAGIAASEGLADVYVDTIAAALAALAVS